MTNAELESKIKDLRQLAALIDEAKTEAESLKDEIKAYMGREEVLKVGEYTVTYKPVKSARIDTTALRKAFPEVAETVTKETTARRFCIL